jgi:hypothetical protein
MIWWVLGFVCAGLVAVAVAVVVYFAIREGQARKHVADHGEATVGWLVQANSNLFEDGNLDYPALVLISPDPDVADDEPFMTRLAERIMGLKGADCDDDDEAFVSGLVTDETYREGRRDKLPKSLTKGKAVYLGHIWVCRDHLPGKKLTQPFVPCTVIWDEPGSLICTRPHRRKAKEF